MPTEPPELGSYRGPRQPGLLLPIPSLPQGCSPFPSPPPGCLPSFYGTPLVLLTSPLSSSSSPFFLPHPFRLVPSSPYTTFPLDLQAVPKANCPSFSISCFPLFPSPPFHTSCVRKEEEPLPLRTNGPPIGSALSIFFLSSKPSSPFFPYQ